MDKKPEHPGTIFLKTVMEPLGLSVSSAARLLGVQRKTLWQFTTEQTSLSPQMAMRIAIATDTDPKDWLEAQMALTLWEIKQTPPDKVSPNSMIR